MRGGIETLPSSVLQEILNGRLGAVDLAQLESCSSMFRAPSGIVPCETKSMAEAAAHHSCQTHPVFENLPAHARLALLARCDGHWKQVLHFLECLLRMRGCSIPASARSNIVATSGGDHTLIVNRKGDLYITSGEDSLSKVYCHIAPEPQSTLRLIFSQPTANRILQISANCNHAAFVTESGQVQVSTKGFHVAAVTKAGRLFTWGSSSHGCHGHNNCCDELRPKRVKHGGFARLFIVCATAGYCHSAAIDSSGLVYTWGHDSIGQSHTPLLIDSLKAYRAVLVVACDSPFVVLDNGQVHYFGTNKHKCYKGHTGSFRIKGHKIQSISAGFDHSILVMMKGPVFGFGRNNMHQLGVVDLSALSDDIVSTPTEVFVAITKFKRVPRLLDGKELEQPDVHQP